MLLIDVRLPLTTSTLTPLMNKLNFGLATPLVATSLRDTVFHIIQNDPRPWHP
jgi:hypothetical protein